MWFKSIGKFFRGRAPIFWFFSAFSAFIFFGFLLFAFINWSMLMEREVSSMEALTVQLEDSVSDIFSNNVADLKLLKRRVIDVGAFNNPEAVQSLYVELVGLNDSLVALSLIDLDGRAVVVVGPNSLPRDIGHHASLYKSFRRMVDTGARTGSPPFFQADPAVWSVPVYEPLYDNQAVMIGAIRADFSIDPASSRWRLIELLPGTSLMLVSKSGEIQFSSAASNTADEPIYQQLLSADLVAQLTSDLHHGIPFSDQRICERCIVVAGELGRFGNYLFLVREFDEMVENYNEIVFVPLCIVVVLLVALLLFYGFFASNQKRHEERLIRMANYEPVTGLPNRALVLDRLRYHLASAQRDGSPMGVLHLSVTGLKVVNDTQGHEAGNELLRLVGERLTKKTKSGDTIACLGGNQFIVVLPNLQRSYQVELIARRLIEAFKQPFSLSVQEIFVSISIGISVYPDDASTPEMLLQNASVALHHVKGAGGNSFFCFSSQLTETMSRHLAISTQLRYGLANREFKLVYQPQYDIASGVVMGVEALCRWESAELGTVPPLEFIPVAEDTGLIVEIGLWVFEQACVDRQAMEDHWQVPVRMSINVSVRQMREKNFREQIHAILLRTNSRPEQLELEITESLLLDEFAQKLLFELRADGFWIAIDDFGTGYASLSYLPKCPVTTLKIDRSFIIDFPGSSDSYSLVNAVISLAKSFDLGLVAEGVEETNQLTELERLGCRIGQGFGLCRPLPLAVLLKQGARAPERALG